MAHNHPGSGGEGIAVLQAPLEDIQRGFRMGMSRSIFARSEWGAGDMGSAAKPGGPHVDMDEMPGQARHDGKERSLSATGSSLRLQHPVGVPFRPQTAVSFTPTGLSYAPQRPIASRLDSSARLRTRKNCPR